MRKKNKPKRPTTDEFLQYIPNRTELEWAVNSKGLVEIMVPKFKSKFGKSFLNLIKKENKFAAKMDKIGSTVWKECDGKKRVKDILDILNKKFPKEKNIDQRLFLFLQQMHSLKYIELLVKQKY